METKKMYKWVCDGDHGCFTDESKKSFDSKEDCYNDMRDAALNKMKWNTEYKEDFVDSGKDDSNVIGYKVYFSQNKITHESYSGEYIYKIVEVNPINDILNDAKNGVFSLSDLIYLNNYYEETIGNNGFKNKIYSLINWDDIKETIETTLELEQLYLERRDKNTTRYYIVETEDKEISNIKLLKQNEIYEMLAKRLEKILKSDCVKKSFIYTQLNMSKYNIN